MLSGQCGVRVRARAAVSNAASAVMAQAARCSDVSQTDEDGYGADMRRLAPGATRLLELVKMCAKLC